MSPYVSVLMSAYNAEKFIGEAIESILNQSYENFEFIIVDDGSEDSTREIIQTYSNKDDRIKVLQNISNSGLIYSLNRGLDEAKGKYIARMDADDISLPSRLETQVSFMESHQEVGVVSAWMKTFGQGKETVWPSPERHEEIVTKLFCNNCLWHPVALIRKNTLDENNLRYDSNHPKAEDYKLWVDIAGHKKLANIPEVLHRYRLHDQQKTRLDKKSKPKNPGKTIRNREKKGLRQMLLTDFLSREPTENELMLHAKLFFEIPFREKDELAKIREWVDYLKNENSKNKKYIEPTFSDLLEDKFRRTKAKSFKYYTAANNRRFSPKLLWELFFSDQQYYQSFSNRELVYIILNSLVLRKNRWYSSD